MIKCREVEHAVKSEAQIPTPNRKEVVTEMLNNCRMWTFVTTNASSSQFEAQLYILEDNEAVIKMITKGRSSTMRHVSRTHWVALNRLYDRVNLDPKIQIKYVDTKNQLADMLTKGNSPGMSGTIFFVCSASWISRCFLAVIFTPTNNPKTSSKRQMKEKKPGEEERVVAKSKPMMILVSKTANQSPTALGWKIGPGNAGEGCSRIRSTASLSRDATLPGESIFWPVPKRRIGCGLSWTDEKEFSERIVWEIFKK